MQLTAIGEKLYFTVIDGTEGRATGNRGSAMEPNRQRSSSRTSSAAGIRHRRSTAVGDRLFFTVFRRGWRRRLWKSDGTELGTVLVREASGTSQAQPSSLTSVTATDEPGGESHAVLH